MWNKFSKAENQKIKLRWKWDMLPSMYKFFLLLNSLSLLFILTASPTMFWPCALQSSWRVCCILKMLVKSTLGKHPHLSPYTSGFLHLSSWGCFLCIDLVTAYKLQHLWAPKIIACCFLIRDIHPLLMWIYLRKARGYTDKMMWD